MQNDEGAFSGGPITTSGATGGDVGFETGMEQSGPKSSAGETAHLAADEAKSVAATAGEGARQVASEATTQAKAVASQAKGQIDSLVGQTRGEVRQQLEQRSTQAASSLRTIADQITALMDGRPEEAGQVSGYLEDAKGRVSSFAERLEQRGPEGLIDDVTSFARRRPGVFLLGAGGVGFAVGRLVRAGRAASQGDDATSTSALASYASSSSYPSYGVAEAPLSQPLAPPTIPDPGVPEEALLGFAAPDPLAPGGGRVTAEPEFS